MQNPSSLPFRGGWRRPRKGPRRVGCRGRGDRRPTRPPARAGVDPPLTGRDEPELLLRAEDQRVIGAAVAVAHRDAGRLRVGQQEIALVLGTMLPAARTTYPTGSTGVGAAWQLVASNMVQASAIMWFSFLSPHFGRGSKMAPRQNPAQEG